MLLKVKTNKGEELLNLTNTEYQELKQELVGEKEYIQEYKTKEGRIITDLEIISVV